MIGVKAMSTSLHRHGTSRKYDCRGAIGGATVDSGGERSVVSIESVMTCKTRCGRLARIVRQKERLKISKPGWCAQTRYDPGIPRKPVMEANRYEQRAGSLTNIHGATDHVAERRGLARYFISPATQPEMVGEPLFIQVLWIDFGHKGLCDDETVAWMVCELGMPGRPISGRRVWRGRWRGSTAARRRRRNAWRGRTCFAGYQANHDQAGQGA